MQLIDREAAPTTWPGPRLAPPGATAVPSPLASLALARPEETAFVCSRQRWTGRELHEAVLRAAGRLAGAGIAPGEVVGLVGPPSPEWAIACHALGWIGAAVAPLPPRPRRRELAAALAAARPDRVLLTHGLAPADRALYRELAPEPRFLTELAPGEAPPERFWPLDEVRVVALTSGTTGAPTAVPLTTAQVVFSAFGSAIRLGHLPGDAWLSCLPLHHVGGLMILLRCALYGTTVVLHRRFDPAAAAASLDTGEATLVSLVPTLLERVLDARPEVPFPASLRAVLLGGDATPPALLERCRRLEVPVAVTWGMTEAASQVATRYPGEGGDGCGAPLPFARVASEAGFLAVSGPLTGGRLLTRDLGALDADGRVRVAGRGDDFLVSGGETVSVREVEEVLRGHPAVGDACVVPLADDRWGQRPAALLARASGADPERPEGMRLFCRAYLAPAKVPVRFAWVEALPRTDLGKVDRGAVRDALGIDGVAPRPAPAAPARRAAVPAPPAAPALTPPGPVRIVLERLLDVARAAGAPALAARLGAVREELGADLVALEDALLAHGVEQPPERLARRAAGHLLLQPGKRLRPLCVLLAARLGDEERAGAAAALEVAVAAELVHSATLLHDDVIDEGTERRGAPTANAVLGNSASVLGGDCLFAEALRRVAGLSDHRLLERLLGVIAEMVDAEALQLALRGRVDAGLADYLRVAEGKTAALFAWSLWAGGRIAGLPDAACEVLSAVGADLGVAFQVVDDLLDLSDPAQTGKDALADVRQGKMTCPLVLAGEADPGVREALGALLDGAVPPAPEALAALQERVEAAGAVAASRALASERAAQALAALGELPPGWARELLQAVVTAAVERSR